MIAPYSPIAALYFKHQRGIHDFLAYGAIYLLVGYLDAAASVSRINLAPFTLPLFGFFFASANYLVKSFEKQDLFKMFGNHSYTYCLAMSFASWVAYSLMYRPQMFGAR